MPIPSIIWLGEGKVLSALQIQRSSAKEKITDRVQATILYKDGVVNFYHGFDQPKNLDRQELRLQFERGEITLYEWVLVKMKLHGLVTDEQLAFLKDLVGECKVTYHGHEQTKNRKVRGRFNEINFDRDVTLECGDVEDKQKRYEQLLINMLSDQWSWVKDRNHSRVINDKNAVDSLRIAEDASKISKRI